VSNWIPGGVYPRENGDGNDNVPLHRWGDENLLHCGGHGSTDFNTPSMEMIFYIGIIRLHTLRGPSTPLTLRFRPRRTRQDDKKMVIMANFYPIYYFNTKIIKNKLLRAYFFFSIFSISFFNLGRSFLAVSQTNPRSTPK
jgi:hypothetical protein